MAPVLGLALASCILTLASAEQQGECPAHLASPMSLGTWGASERASERASTDVEKGVQGQ